MATNKHLCSIHATDRTYFLFTTFRDQPEEGSDFDVVLTDAINVWTTKVTENNLKALSDEIDEDYKKYVSETRKALTKQDLGKLTFEYEVRCADDGCRDLAWKRVMSDDGIKFQLGVVTLKPADDPSDYIYNTLQYSMQEIAAAQAKTRHLEMENDRLSSERRQALKRLEKCVELKENLEHDMYSKFCVVLNEKKAKIRDLHQQGSKAADRTASARNSVEDTSGDGAAEQKEEDESDEMSTDDEKEVLKHDRKRTEQITTETDKSFILEDTAVPATSYGKRRRRQPEERPKVTPSKPSIPRVPSIVHQDESMSGTPDRRTPSMRKTPSRKGRSAELDASDLFDEM